MAAAAAAPAPPFVHFNVGGTRFTMLRDTVLKEPASRLALLVRGVMPAVRDEQQGIFLDRSPKLFQQVLNYLRDGWCSLPLAAEDRRELLQECRHYQLAGMEAWLHTQDILGGVSAVRSGAASPERWQLSSGAASPPAPGLGGASPSWPAAGGWGAAEPALALATADAACAGPAAFAAPACGRASTAAAALHSPGALAACPRSTSSSFSFVCAGRASADLLSAGVSAAVPGGAWPAPLAKGPSSAGGGGSSLGTPAQPSSSLSFLPGGYGGAASANAAQQQPLMPPPRRLSPPPMAEGFKTWASRYIQGNPGMQAAVDTLLELAFLAPHPSLHGGRTSIAIASECSHGSPPGPDGAGAGGFPHKVLRVRSTSGWAFEFSLRPSSDASLVDKYAALSEFLQDNWFVLRSLLADTYGVSMEQDTGTRPKCALCRRSNITLSLQKLL